MTTKKQNMKNTASTFLQHLENNKTPGHQKVVGFIVYDKVVKLQFPIFPTIEEWLSICRVWSTIFEHDLNQLHIQKI